MDSKPVTGHYTGAGDELDVEDLYTKYKVKEEFDIFPFFFSLFLCLLIERKF